jgi:hypothetical protein
MDEDGGAAFSLVSSAVAYKPGAENVDVLIRGQEPVWTTDQAWCWLQHITLKEL